MRGGVEPRLPALEPGCRFFPRLRFSPRRELRVGFPTLGLEEVEMVDSAGELAPERRARDSRSATVSPSVKLEEKKGVE